MTTVNGAGHDHGGVHVHVHGHDHGADHVNVKRQRQRSRDRDRDRRPERDRRNERYAAAAAGYTATRVFDLPWRSNFTSPSILANSVQSRPMPTLSPAWNFVPTCRTSTLPAFTAWPAKRLTPRIFGFESRPLRVEPCPF